MVQAVYAHMPSFLLAGNIVINSMPQVLMDKIQATFQEHGLHRYCYADPHIECPYSLRASFGFTPQPRARVPPINRTTECLFVLKSLPAGPGQIRLWNRSGVQRLLLRISSGVQL